MMCNGREITVTISLIGDTLQHPPGSVAIAAYKQWLYLNIITGNQQRRTSFRITPRHLNPLMDFRPTRLVRMQGAGQYQLGW
jgi:hypothetical protein